jgi:acetyltransferase-like isoleucine patch superfamily enzyme
MRQISNFLFHSRALRANLQQYCEQMGLTIEQLTEVYDRLVAKRVIIEKPFGNDRPNKTYVSHIDVSNDLENPDERMLYLLLLGEIPVVPFPNYGVNWPTLVDRLRRWYEQIYNILICKIPVHSFRLAWLRLGGAKIGKGSSVWRNTEVLGIENLQIGEDSVVAWHCLLDARAGLVIGNHVTIASYVLLIGGQHDLTAPTFDSLGETIHVGDYAWIASRALITGGGQVGEGAIVGGATVINKPVSPYKIVTGPTGKPIGERPRNLNYRVGGKSLFTLLH